MIPKERPINDFYLWGAKIWWSAWPVTPSLAHLCAQEKEEQRQRWCDRWISVTSPSTSWLGSWGDLTWKKECSEESILHMKNTFFRLINWCDSATYAYFDESDKVWLRQQIIIHLHECVNDNMKSTATVHGLINQFFILYLIVHNLF